MMMTIYVYIYNGEVYVCMYVTKRHHFPYSKDLVVSPVSRHFSYSMEFVVSHISKHFWEGWKIRSILEICH